MANEYKYDPTEWQWVSRTNGTQKVADMTKEELRQALCRTIDMLETIQEQIGSTVDKINGFMKDG